MTTQQLSLEDHPKIGEADGLAVVFLIMGAPHIYSFLRRRSHQPTVDYLPRVAIGSVAVLIGLLMFLSF